MQEEIISYESNKNEIPTCFIVNAVNTGLFSIKIENDAEPQIQKYSSLSEIKSIISEQNCPLLIHTQTQNQVWMPQELLEEKNAKNLINYAAATVEQEVYHYPIQKFDVISFFNPIEPEWITEIKNKKPEITLIDPISAFMEQIQSPQNGLYLHIGKQQLIVVLIEQDKLKFAKQFVCNSTNELPYFLNLIFKELHISIKNPKIFLSGSHQQFNVIYQKLSSNYQVIKHLTEIPLSQYEQEVAYLLNLCKCVLSVAN